MTKSDTQIRLCEAPSEEKEVVYVIEQATKAVNVGDTAAILIPSAQKIWKSHATLTLLAKQDCPLWLQYD